MEMQIKSLIQQRKCVLSKRASTNTNSLQASQLLITNKRISSMNRFHERHCYARGNEDITIKSNQSVSLTFDPLGFAPL